MKKDRKNSKPVGINILEINKTKFYENDLEELGIQSLDENEIKTNINYGFNIDEKKEKIKLILNVNTIANQESELKLYGIQTKHIFKIKNLANIIKKIEKEVVAIPDKLSVILLSISYSDTRGMLSVLLTNPLNKRLLLPIIDPKKLLESNTKKN